MTKEHWAHLKENDPIHYAEMRGDPVTGMSNDNKGCFDIVVTTVILIVLIILIFILWRL